ncbi:MAG: DUF2510 domain-containing protein [Actinomycetota bacterium]|nr:DUF2510 domain-containing protein [Actinomycetota bacterium]
MNEGAWQPDPTHRHQLRWWDGAGWTDHVSDNGVAGIDPPGFIASAAATAITPAPPASPWGAPAVGAPPPATAHASPADALREQGVILTESAPPPSKPSRRGLIAGAAVAVVAVVVGALLFLGGGDDDERTLGDDIDTTLSQSVTTSATSPATTDVTGTESTVAATDPTTEPTTPETTDAPSTTIISADDTAALLAALPTADDVPASWTLSGEPDTAPEVQSGPGAGYCGGSNAISRALHFESSAQVGGGYFDIAGGGSFTVDAYLFPDDDLASKFLSASGGQANDCDGPTTYTRPESEFDMFAPGSGDAAVWSLAETSSAGFAPSTDADEVLSIVSNTIATTTDEGLDYGVTIDDRTIYERHGRVVLVFNLSGYHGFVGFSTGEPTWAFTPTAEAVNADIAVVRPGILQRLADSGLL